MGITDRRRRAATALNPISPMLLHERAGANLSPLCSPFPPWQELCIPQYVPVEAGEKASEPEECFSIRDLEMQMENHVVEIFIFPSEGRQTSPRT